MYAVNKTTIGKNWTMLDIFAIREMLLYCIALSVLHLQILSEQVFLPGSHTFPPLVQQDYIYKIAQTSVCTAIKLSCEHFTLFTNTNSRARASK